MNPLLAADTPLVHPHVDWPVLAPVIALFAAALLVVLIRSIVRHQIGRAHV